MVKSNVIPNQFLDTWACGAPPPTAASSPAVRREAARCTQTCPHTPHLLQLPAAASRVSGDRAVPPRGAPEPPRRDQAVPPLLLLSGCRVVPALLQLQRARDRQNPERAKSARKIETALADLILKLTQQGVWGLLWCYYYCYYSVFFLGSGKC